MRYNVFFLVIVIFMFLSTTHILAQSVDYVYGHRNEKLEAVISRTHFTIAAESIEDLELGARAVSSDIKSTDTYDGGGYYWAVIDLEDSLHYESSYNVLRSKSYLLSVEPVFRVGQILTASSHFFYLKLKDALPIDRLNQLLLETNCKLTKVVGTTQWVQIEVTTASRANSIEMANYFFESGFFQKVDYGLFSKLETSCSGNSEPDFNNQWGLLNQSNQGVDINVCEAWPNTNMGAGVKVAVIDEGVVFSHPELTSHADNPSRHASTGGLQDPQQVSPAGGNYSHGTHVAGIIAAADNNEYIMGVAPEVDLFSLSIDLYFTTGSEWVALAEGIEWLWKDQGVDVINCSWMIAGDGGFAGTMVADAFEQALTYGRNGLGCVVVFSAGNTAPAVPYYESSVSFPARSHEDILCVSAINEEGEHYASTATGAEVDITAPGVMIMSLGQVGTFYDTGTSMAAPHVAGAAALLLSNDPCLTNKEVNSIIEKASYKIGDGNGYNYYDIQAAWSIFNSHRPNGDWNHYFGYGLLDVDRVINSTSEYFIQNTAVYSDTILARFGRIFAGESVDSDPIVPTGDVVIHPRATTIFQSDKEVTLDVGFEVKAGANFTACVKPYVGSCGTWLPAMRRTQPVFPGSRLTELSNSLDINRAYDSGKDELSIFHFYPNPATGYCYLKSLESFEGSIQVSFYNSLGTLIKNVSLFISGKDEVALLKLPEGERVIFIQACTELGCQTQKIIQHAP